MATTVYLDNIKIGLKLLFLFWTFLNFKCTVTIYDTMNEMVE